MFEIIEKEDNGTIIKVIGVGGAGGNAIDHMIRENVHGVQFIAANTDAQALNNSLAGHRMQLGNSGLGAGAKPAAGRAAAEEQRLQIRDMLQGAHMVFITAGMGGGTGTGAAPIVAEVARELGILSVAVVTKPFGFEGKRMKAAEVGIAELEEHVDSLIVILNDRLMDVLGDDAEMEACFKAADDVLRNAVGGIAEIITLKGLVNVDFEDVRTVMGAMGRAMMGSAAAEGLDRARLAAEQAVACPLLEGVELAGAKGVLVNITASKSLKMREVNEVMATIGDHVSDEAEIIFGAVFDESMGDQMRVTVVATGLEDQKARGVKTTRETLTVIEPLRATGTGDATPFGDFSQYDLPPGMRSARQSSATVAPASNLKVEAFVSQGVDHYDIPAFLRKQAD
jgi:cell division protein FtsZ